MNKAGEKGREERKGRGERKGYIYNVHAPPPLRMAKARPKNDRTEMDGTLCVCMCGCGACTFTSHFNKTEHHVFKKQHDSSKLVLCLRFGYYTLRASWSALCRYPALVGHESVYVGGALGCPDI